MLIYLLLGSLEPDRAFAVILDATLGLYLVLCSVTCELLAVLLLGCGRSSKGKPEVLLFAHFSLCCLFLLVWVV